MDTGLNASTPLRINETIFGIFEKCKNMEKIIRGMEDSLTNNYNKTNEEFKLRIDKLFNEYESQAKVIGSLKLFVILGIFINT